MKKPLTEAAREREILRFTGHIHEHLQSLASPEGYNNARRTAAHDSAELGTDALKAFAQLGTFRLGLERCMISIFDRKNQYVIVEVTQDSSLVPGHPPTPSHSIYPLITPRSRGICERVLQSDTNSSDGFSPLPIGNGSASDLPVFVIPNIADNSLASSKPSLQGPPYNRFYAGVPIRSPKGINIGVFAAFGNTPRNSLEDTQIQFLQEISATIMAHLESRVSGKSYQRSERMVRGLGSFVEGKSTMSRWWLGPNTGSFEGPGFEGVLNTQQQLIEHNREAAIPSLEEDREIRPTPSSLQPERRQPKPRPGSKTVDVANLETDQPRLDESASPLPGIWQEDLTAAKHSAPPPASALTHGSDSAITSTPSSDEDVNLTVLRNAFDKAANVIRESIEVEGVVFLDARVGSYGGLIPELSRELSRSDSPPESQTQIGDQEHPDTDQSCNVLGFSTSELSSIDNFKASSMGFDMSERLLKKLLRKNPQGRIFNLDEGGLVTSSGESEGEVLQLEEEKRPAPPEPSVTEPSTTRTQVGRKTEEQMIISMFPKARSIALVPLWDSHKEKWFAAAFMWTETPSRIFTMEGELSYLRAFGMAIMAEVHRIETIQAEKAKSDLLGSISHELRSPLHGIVAAVELMQDTTLDAFQGDIIHSIEACGRTLLDVMDHLLDHSKINKLAKDRREQERKTRHRYSGSGDRMQSFESRMPGLSIDVEVDALAEESIESVYTGFNFQRLSIAQVVREDKREHYDVGTIRRQDSLNAVETFRDRRDGDGLLQVTLGAVAVYLDIDPECSWLCHIQPGALRRIIMNVLGNSLKFTERGFIMVTLEQEVKTDRQMIGHHHLKLTVVDSGRGMSEEFLRNRVFTPFAQEDQLSPGTGLGLSLVQQIVKALKGTIHIESERGRGTSVCITLPLDQRQVSPLPDRTFSNNVDSVRGLRVVLRGLKTHAEAKSPARSQKATEQQLMEKLCRKHLGLEVVPPGSRDLLPDLILCSDLAIGDVTNSTPGGFLPPVVVICRTAVAAHKFLMAYRKSARFDILEFISQPVGPRKLAKALVLALNRFNDSRSSMLPMPSGTSNLFIPDPFSSDMAVRTAEDAGKSQTRTSSDEPKSDDGEGTVSKNLQASHGGDSVNEPKEDETPGGSSEQQEPRNDQCSKYLLVDDNKINVQILASFMKKLQNPYRSASNGLEALEAYKEEQGRYCCVLMDISMPVMDGFESTRRIREFERQVGLRPATIIALTGLASASAQQEAFASGIDLFMTKPVRLKELGDALSERNLR